MRAQQFIKDHGLERAREVLTIVPENEYYFTNVMIKPCGNWVYSQIAQLTHHDGVKFNVSFKLLEEWKPKFANLADLKRLVESVDRVNQRGGYLATKELLSFSIVHQEAFGKDAVSEETINSLKGEIADYESIYGEGNE